MGWLLAAWALGVFCGLGIASALLRSELRARDKEQSMGWRE